MSLQLIISIFLVVATNLQFVKQNKTQYLQNAIKQSTAKQDMSVLSTTSGFDVDASHSVVSRRNVIPIVWKIPVGECRRRHWTCNYNRMKYEHEGKDMM